MKRLSLRNPSRGTAAGGAGDLARNLELQSVYVSPEECAAAATVIFRHFRDDHGGRDEVLEALGLQH